jgi:hypothetical protein
MWEWLMGLVSKARKEVTPPAPQDEVVELTKAELALIIRVLGTATFPVKDIEVLYKAIYKLQQIYNTLED